MLFYYLRTIYELIRADRVARGLPSKEYFEVRFPGEAVNKNRFIRQDNLGRENANFMGHADGFFRDTD